MVIGVRLIQLHQREFRVVAGVQSLVTEHAPDLVHSLHAADDQPFQIQLQRNAQLQILVQRVEVGFKRARRRTARIGDQHGGFHLHKAALVQKAADGADDAGTFDKGVAHLGVDDQIDIPLTIAGVGVGQTVEFFRQRLQALGQQRDLLGVDGDLAGFGFEHGAADADQIADIKFFEIGIWLLPNDVPRHIRLDGALQILHMAKGRFAHHAFGHHASRHGDFGVFQRVKVRFDLLAVVGHGIFGDGKGVLARLLQRRQLVPTNLQQLAALLFGHFLCRIFALLHIAHDTSSFPIKYETDGTRWGLRPLASQKAIPTGCAGRLWFTIRVRRTSVG